MLAKSGGGMLDGEVGDQHVDLHVMTRNQLGREGVQRLL